MIELEQDNYLTIQLLSYNNNAGECFSFLEMSTLQATTLLPLDKKIVEVKIMGSTDANKYFDEHSCNSFKTIADFNAFFLTHPNYYIDDCNIELEDGTRISSHDDGEVAIQFSSEDSDKAIINSIFEKYGLDKNLIDILKNKPGHYFAIDKQSNIIAEFESFDDYLKNR